jgi:ketosteroid isomerase-like protein
MVPKLLTLAAISLLLASCAREPQVDLAAEKAAVQTALDNYVTAVEQEDWAAYSAVMSQSTDMVNFGAFGSPVVGQDGLRQVMQGQFDGLADVTIDVSEMHIDVEPSGQFAWATCLWTFKGMMGETPLELPVRCTWILKKEAGRWVIAHWHKSVAAG